MSSQKRPYSLVRAALVGLLLLTIQAVPSYAQVSNVSNDEVERRNAAVAFVQLSDATLQVLRVECGYLMPGEAPRVDAIARAWFDRNRDDIVAANVWAGQYLTHAKSISSEAHQRVSNALTTALSNGLMANIKTYFKQLPPSAESCSKALAPYAQVQLDIQNVGQNAGYEQFGEFGKTLKDFQGQSGYSIPASFNTKFQEKVSFQAIASIDAALAARERGDGASMRSIYEKLATHGEATAAQSLGVAFFNGDLAPKDLLQAYRWFYAAWGLGDFQGLNAMGVMLRDGSGVPINTGLAYGAFLMATQGAQTKNGQELAKRNTERLQASTTENDLKTIACMTLDAFDAELKKPVATQPLPRLRGMYQGQRKLGQMVRALNNVNLAECP